MFKKLFFVYVGCFLLSNSNAVTINTFDNFTRFIFDKSDFNFNTGNIQGDYWFYPSGAGSNNCIVSTVPIFIPANAQLTGQIEFKAKALIWIEKLSDYYNTNIFTIKNISSNGNTTFQESNIYLSALSDMRVLYYRDMNSYIEAKTVANDFIQQPFIFNSRDSVTGKMKFCISSVIPKLELGIRTITIEARM
ncbi:hypothetical protein QEJ31_06105 [Pigmentibacter sp. JX0631]|uniref:hypothetical protein n=1 Tax=Pigmentibacter sp. JX0631 TaxID=2976982 RepID=UPI002469C500|nr:hypothetical protein [Pigmentibacter sp. JX0631]WGL61168.1 hypothetical protein QEJ31_06105 [Pigmentibacter sp. JX0631]